MARKKDNDSNNDEFPDEANVEEKYVSKSSKKRTMNGVHDIAMQLVELSQGNFNSLPIDDDLRYQIELTRKISAHGAKRRQLRFLGQYISKLDYEAVEEALAVMNHQKNKTNAKFHEAEELRDALIAGSEDAVSEVLKRFPQADRQQLRTLQRNAQKDRTAAGAPKASRAIFRFIKELSDAEPDSEPEE